LLTTNSGIPNARLAEIMELYIKGLDFYLKINNLATDAAGLQ
jgi:hypothetical protein